MLPAPPTSVIEEIGEHARNFCLEYILDFSKANAARRAGVSVQTAEKYLNDERCKVVIADFKRRASDRVNISVDNTLESLRRVKEASPIPVLNALMNPFPGLTPLQSVAALPDDLKFAIAGISRDRFGVWKVDMHDKMAAVVHIGKFQGIFVDRSDIRMVTANVNAIEDDMTPEEAMELYQAEIGKGK